MLFCTRPDSLLTSSLAKMRCITFRDGTTLAKVEEFKYLGLWFDSQLSLHQNGTNFSPLLGP